MSLRICLLGGLRVVADGDALPLGGPAQQLVLARLLVADADGATLDQLADAVWPDQAPPKYATTLHAYISRLRRQFAPWARIPLDQGRYRFRLDAGSSDIADLRQSLARARHAKAARRHEQIAKLLEPLVRSWPDEPPVHPFGDEPWARGFAQRAEQSKLAATRLVAESHLLLCRPAVAVDLLGRAAARHPFEEELVAQLMLSQYRAGQQSDALATYARCRRRLATELGVDPGAELEDLHVRILRRDPGLDWVEPERPLAIRLTPEAPLRLVGRDRELSDVRRHLAEQRLCTLHGLPGVGKSTLAAEIAKTHSGTVCWVPAADRSSAFAALIELASRLGAPAELDERDALADLDQRLAANPGWLIIFDDAETLADIRPLLPGDRSGQMLITSRSPSWSALGPTISLGSLTADAATVFVSERVGPDPAAERVARALGGLPLALEQACRYLEETQSGIEDYLDLLGRRRHDLLGRGAPPSHPEPVLRSWEMVFAEIRLRSPLAARMLETAAVFSADGVPLQLLESVAAPDGDELEVADALSVLLRFSMLDRRASVVAMHRLVQDVLLDGMDLAERTLLVTRAADAIAAELASVGPLVSTDTGLWLARVPQIAALIRATERCPAVPARLLELIHASYQQLRSRAAWQQASGLLDTAISVVQRGTVPAVSLAELYAERGECADAEGRLAAAGEDLERAVALLAASTGPAVEVARARTLARLAHVQNCGDDPVAAAENYRLAIDVLTADGDTEEWARSMVGLGYALWGQDRFAEAEGVFQALLDRLDDETWSHHPLYPSALSGLGMMLHEQGHWTEARKAQLAAIDTMIDIFGESDHPDIAYALDKLGYVEGLLGDHGQAVAHHRRAAAMLQRLFGADDPRAAMVISNQGEAERAIGDLASAAASQRRAHRTLLANYGSQHRNTRLVAARLDDVVVSSRDGRPGGTVVATSSLRDDEQMRTSR